MNIREMIARQRELLETARAAGRGLTTEEAAEFDSLSRQIEEATNAATRQAATPATDPEQNVPEDDTQNERQLIEAERERIRSIETICSNFGMEARSYIENGATVDSVREAALEHVLQNGSPIGASVRMTDSAEDKFRRAMTDALLMRSGVEVSNPADGANQMRGMSLRSMAIECLQNDGVTGQFNRMNSDDIYTELCRQYFNPSATFPAIMDATIKKSIVELYKAVPTTFQAFTTKGSLPDFKTTADHEYVIGGVGDFLKVPENGEIKPDTPRTELLPQRKLDTYGKQFSMTRQAFINDDIGFVTQVPGLYATAAKKTIDKEVYKILFNNPAIFDGTALFHTNHKNLIGSGSKPTQAAIQAIILQMQKQTDQFGEPIYITPKTIVVPVGYEFDLAVILHSAQVVGSSNNDINPLYNYPLQIVQSPILNFLAGANACPWFMFADASSARGIQVDYLNGQETPTVRRMEAPGVLGFTWDIWLDWGISVRDFRGIAKNPGVAIS